MTGRSVSLCLFIGLVGLIAGVVFGVGLAETSEQEPRVDVGRQGAEVGGRESRETPSLTPDPSLMRLKTPSDGSAGDARRDEEAEALISEALLAYAQQSWEERRAELGCPAKASERIAFRQQYTEQVMQLPSIMAARQARDARREEEQSQALAAQQQELEEGSVNALMDLLEERHAVDLEGGLLDRVVRGRQTLESRDGNAFAESREPLSEGMVLTFPPGIHRLDARRLRGEGHAPFPRDVSIVGSGMNATLLRLSSFDARSNVERLLLSDLTIDCENNGLTDLRSGNLSVEFQRVRLVRFDAGHGGCVLLTGDEGVAMIMTDCEVLGGFGRRPGRGRLVSTAGSPEYALRCINVRFELLDMALMPRHHALFIGCQFDRLTNKLPTSSETLEFRDCSFGQTLSRNYKPEEHRRSLNELFPGAEER